MVASACCSYAFVKRVRANIMARWVFWTKGSTECLNTEGLAAALAVVEKVAPGLLARASFVKRGKRGIGES